MNYLRRVVRHVRQVLGRSERRRRSRWSWLAASAAFALLGAVGAVSAAVGAVQQQLGWAGAIVAAVGSGTATIAGLLADKVGRDRPAGPIERHAGDAADMTGLLFRREGRLPLVREVTADQLGIKAAVHSDRAADLPLYVRRDVDDALAAAADIGGFIVLHGPAAAGKSRTAYELIQRYPTRTLYVPDPDRRDVLERLAQRDPRPQDAVIWLDDLDRYLVPGSLDRTVLESLRAADDRSVLLVGTIRDQAWPADHGVVRHFGASVLRSTEHTFFLDRALTPAERQRARRVRSDDRVAVALRSPGVGFGESLAAGPQLMDRWRRAADTTGAARVGYAIVAASVDFRRAGYPWPVPATALEHCYRQYLPVNLRWHPDLAAFEDGLRWAREIVYDTSACLASYAGDRYIAYDYLLDQTQAGAGPLGAGPVEVAAWKALLEVADGDGMYQVGVAAYLAGRTAEAETAFHRSADAGCAASRHAAFAAGVLRQERDNDRAAERWWRVAAEQGHAGAMLCMSVVVAAQGDAGGSAAWYLRAAQATTVPLAYSMDGPPPEDPRLAAMRELARAVDHAGTARWWLRVKGRKIAAALYTVGEALSSRGDVANAEQWWRPAADAGHPPAMAAMAVAARRRGDPAEAVRWFESAIKESDDVVTMRALAGVYHEMRDLAAAERWYQTAVNRGDREALRELVELHLTAGRPMVAAEWYLRTLEAHDEPSSGHPVPYELVYRLLDMLRARPDEVTGPGAASVLAQIGAWHVRTRFSGDAPPWLRLAADAGDRQAQCNLAVVLDADGESDAAEQMLMRSAASGEPTALYNLGVLYDGKRDPASAERYYTAGARAGSVDAMLRLARLEAPRDADASVAWIKRARAHGAGDRAVHLTLARVREDSGDVAGALAAYELGAHRNDGRAMIALGVLHLDAGRTDEAAHWLHEAAYSSDAAARIVAHQRLTALCTEHDHGKEYQTLAELSNRPRSDLRFTWD